MYLALFLWKNKQRKITSIHNAHTVMTRVDISVNTSEGRSGFRSKSSAPSSRHQLIRLVTFSDNRFITNLSLSVFLARRSVGSLNAWSLWQPF